MGTCAVAVIASIALPVGAAEDKARKRRAAWDEVSTIVRLLPARRSGDPEKRYYVTDSVMQEVRKNVAVLDDGADIIPAIAERLKKLNPSSEENEVELVNLVAILELRPDRRALAALDRVASLKSPTIIDRGEGDRYTPYPYAQKAKKLAEEIRIRLATEAWQRELAGLPEAERVERTSRYAWGIEDNADEPKRHAAANLLEEFDYKIWWPRLVAQLPDANAQDVVSLRKADWMPYWIQYATSEEKSHPTVKKFILQFAASADLNRKQWAMQILRMRHSKELQERVAALKESADVVAAVAERIMNLDSSTEENEAELVQLVETWQFNLDPRGLAALDHAASLKSPTVVYLRDGSTIIPYDYAEQAKWRAQELRDRLSREAWERELTGLPEAERVERISRYVWGIEDNSDEQKRVAAGKLLHNIASDIWWPRIVAQLPDLNAKDEVSLRKSQWMPEWILFGIHSGYSHSSVDEFVRQAAASERLKDWAEDAVRK